MTYTSILSTVKTGVSKRQDFFIQSDKAAIIVIDIQDYLSSPPKSKNTSSGSDNSYLFQHALPKALPNIVRLVQTMRKLRDGEEVKSANETACKSGCEIIFTYLEALTCDCRDMSLDYKLSGPKFQTLPRPTCEATFSTLPKELTPQHPSSSSTTVTCATMTKGDICIPKTSCSVFTSTNLNYVLRNLQIEQIIICGQLTDQCVLSAVRDGADLGYFVTVVEDACAALSIEDHTRGLDGMRGFSRIVGTDDILNELQRSRSFSDDAKIDMISISNTNSLNSDAKQETDGADHEEKDFIPLLQTLPSSSITNDSSAMEALVTTLNYAGVKFLRFASMDIVNSMRTKAVPLKRIMTVLRRELHDQYHNVQSNCANILNHQVSMAKVVMAGLPIYADAIVSESNLSARDVLVIKPDLRTLHILPYAKESAMVLGTLHDQKTGELSKLCTRGLLGRVIETAKIELGLGFAVGAEIEFCLYKSSSNWENHEVPVDQSLFAHPTTLNEQNTFLNDLYGFLEQQNIDIELIHAESASGQLEVVLPYQRDVLRMADMIIITKETIRECAKMHGLRAVFTPKLRSNEAGNGMHVHLSLRDVNTSSLNPSRNIFPSDNGKMAISDVGASFIEGILCSLPSLMSITVPSTNSFSRIGQGCWTGHDISWAYEDKESPLRVCIDLQSRKATNVEYKLMDSSCNVYLALASLLYAGMDGIKNEKKLRPPSTLESTNTTSNNVSNVVPSETLPTSFQTSLKSLSSDQLFRNLMGEELIQCYIAVKNAEIKHEEKRT